jgi:hypothetical protein
MTTALYGPFHDDDGFLALILVLLIIVVGLLLSI